MSQKTIASIISFLIAGSALAFYRSGNFELANMISSIAGFLFLASILLLLMKKTRQFALVYISIFLMFFVTLFSYSYFTGLSIYDLYQPSVQERTDKIADILTKQGLIEDSDKSTSEKATEYVEKLKEKGLLVIDEEPMNIESIEETKSETEKTKLEAKEENKIVDKVETTRIVPENYIPKQASDFSLNYNHKSFEIEWSPRDSDEEKTLLTLYSDTEQVSFFSWNDDFSRVAFVVLNQERDVEYPNRTKVFILDINENGEMTKKEKYNISAFYVCGGNCYVDPVIWLDEERIGYVTYWNQNDETENKVLYLKK
jgi:hypothetical protein